MEDYPNCTVKTNKFTSILTVKYLPGGIKFYMAQIRPVDAFRYRGRILKKHCKSSTGAAHYRDAVCDRLPAGDVMAPPPELQRPTAELLDKIHIPEATTQDSHGPAFENTDEEWPKVGQIDEDRPK